MDSTYNYRIRAISTCDRSGIAILDGVEPSIEFSAPKEFKGRTGYWTPEHLFLAAVASCYVSTFSGLAFNSSFEYLRLEMEADGSLAQDAMGWRFQEIVLHPRLTISHPDQRSLGNRLLHKAKESCLIGRSIACPLELKSLLIIEETPVEAR